jgi:hypothetical protein
MVLHRMDIVFLLYHLLSMLLCSHIVCISEICLFLCRLVAVQLFYAYKQVQISS